MDAHVNYHGQRFDISVPPGGEERARERLLQHAVTEPIAKVSLQTEQKIVASLRPVSMLAWSFSDEQMVQRESELALWKNRRGNGQAPPPPPLTHKAHSNHYFLPTITSSLLPSTVYVDAAGKKVGGVFTKGAKTYIFDKGKLQAKYAHHDLHLPFSISPVRSWNNLLISLGIEGPGIGYCSLNTILATMGQKQRPYLVISFRDEEEFHLHAAIADATGLPSTRARRECRDAPSTFVLTMCQKGTLAQNFNLELLLQSYGEASSKIGCKILSANEIVFLRSLTDTNLSEFLQGIFPPTSGGRALFGLLMGHPLEATISDIVSAKPK
jgi:hypothetical protein